MATALYQSLQLHLPRRHIAKLVGLGLGAGLLGWSLTHESANADLGRQSWRSFRNRFIVADGRVVDNANGGVSHSEGQGYGMLMAATYDDRVVFDSLLNWTLGALGRVDDHLLGWRRQPGQPRSPGDENNATDGDLLIAWALSRAATNWSSGEYRQRAVNIARDILRLGTIEIAGRLVLRPGVAGFDHGEHVVVNPSYYVFPAFRALNAIFPDPRWLRLERDGQSLLADSVYGPHRLIPDWVQVGRSGGRVVPATEWPSRFSWDAVRVPLYSVWAGLEGARFLDGMMDIWFNPEHGPHMPGWWNLRDDGPAPYSATPGVVAVARLLLAARTRSGRSLPIPAPETAVNYYDAALIGVALLAAAETKVAEPFAATS